MAYTSKRVNEMTPSATSSLISKIADMKAAGKDIISFNLGEPDFDTPTKVVDACIKALHDGKTKYVGVGGIAPLRSAICEKLHNDNALDYSAAQICVTTGAKQAIFNAVMALVDPGDEVIVPTPCWVSYVEIIKLAQGVPVLVATKPNFQLDIDAVKNAVTPKTKAIIINTPNNPTGAVYGERDLEALAELAVANDFYVISDEVYEKLIYDGKAHVSIASLFPGIYQRTVTVNGLSKAYSMTGWRVGYSAAPPDIAKAMTSLQGHTTSNSTSFVQYASVAALKECSEDIAAMRNEFCRRRDYMYDRLTAIPGITCTKPGGAFYLMPNISAYFGKSYSGKTIEDSFDFCNYILEHAQVAIVPGAAFEMPVSVRFAYSASMEMIEEGMDRFETALKLLE